MCTTFKLIPDFPMYEASEDGRIRNIKTQRILKGRVCQNGYSDVTLRKDGKAYCKFIHRLVANAFLGISIDDYSVVIDHIDGSRHNNNVSNLRPLSRSENALSFYAIHNTDPELAKRNRRCGVWFVIRAVDGAIPEYYRSFYEAEDALQNGGCIYFQSFGSYKEPELILKK